MPHDPGRVAECRAWLRRAWVDLDSASIKTHDLRELGEACVALDGSLRGIAERAEQLTPFAGVLRYAGEPEEPSPEEAGTALAIARQAYEAVLARLPEEVGP